MEAQELERLNKEKKERSEEELKAEIAARLEFTRDKETLLAKIEGLKELQFLKSLVERGLIGVESAERIVQGKELDDFAIAEIFEKIDEIESMEKIDSILPRDFRLTREEYQAALSDVAAREYALAKLNKALDFLSSGMHPEGLSFLQTAFSFLTVLNKNLMVVQGHTIDIKRSLT